VLQFTLSCCTVFSLSTVQVNDSPLRRLSNVYMATLRLPPVPFVLAIFAAPLLMSAFFTALYLFDLGVVPGGVSLSLLSAQSEGPRGCAFGRRSGCCIGVGQGRLGPLFAV